MANNAPPGKKDFFISYNKADREWAEWIAWHLEEEGDYAAEIQAWDFAPGCNFVLEMNHAIEQCERVVAVLSPDYLSSLFTQPEWAAYFVQDSTAKDRRIVPVRVRECEPKGLLKAIVFVDLVGKPDNEAEAALLEAVRIGRRKPDRAPHFPGRTVSNKPRFPGTLPDVWNVPHLRNPNFTEPGHRLSELRNALRSGKPAALTQALAGLGGVGKTQLAIEYAYRHAADYAIVWWLRSEQAATLAAEYAALATALSLPEKDATEQPVVVSAVREVLRHRQDWLLIFDNANAPDEIRPFLPQSPGHVLITSRHAAWGGIAQKVEVKKWTSEVATEFLLSRTGQTDAGSATELARDLDCLPLALEQAAAYVEAAEKPLADYLAMFRQYKLALLNRGKPTTDYAATVGTTWEISFQRLETESPGGAALLQLCAFLAPDDIPRELIVAGAEHLPKSLREAAGDAMALDEAVAAILRYSLVEAAEGSFSMHRLVQAVVRDRLDISDRAIWAETALKLLREAFPFNCEDVRTWKECDRLLPHVTAAVECGETLNVDRQDTATLVNQMGVYALGRGEYGKAKTAFERALKIDERLFGRDHPRVAIRINNLGTVLRDLGDSHGAKLACKRALEIAEAAYGPDHPEIATYVNNLGNALRDAGDLPGARLAYERALRIDENALGRDHPDVAIDINNLGSALLALGDLPGARAAVERALEINENAFGPHHPGVAIALGNLVEVLVHANDWLGARDACVRALAIDEKALGVGHPAVARDLHNLSGVLNALGDSSGAKAADERALKILEESLGADHPRTRIVRKNLGSFLP